MKHNRSIGAGALAVAIALTASTGMLPPAAHAATTFDTGNTMAQTPPMGWNSYNIFGGTFFPDEEDCSLPGCIPLNETRVKGVAQAMIDSGLRDKGYVYVNIDDRWQDPRQPRDASGQLRWDTRRFPSGIPSLASWLHERGLKLGLYVLPNDRACGGEEGPTGIPDWPDGLPETGSMGHEYTDSATFAQWGVDYLKFDWCGVNETNRRGMAGDVFDLWNDAIAASGRDMLVAASTWGWEQEHTWGPSYAHTWRIDSDVYPRWSDIMRTLDKGSTVALRVASGPTTGWNDFDTMQVGNPGLSPAENRTHFSMWAMSNSPLMLGNDVRNMSTAIEDLVGNDEIIAINQDSMGEQAWLASSGTETQVWARSLADGSKAVALLNRSTSPANINLDFADVFLGSDAAEIRDVTSQTDAGVYAGGYTALVDAHDTLVLKVTPTDSQSYEAEHATLTGGAQVQNCATCSGGQNVGYVGNGAGEAELTVSVPSAAQYSVTLYYNSGVTRSVQLAANGGQPVTLSNLNSGDWSVVSSHTVFVDLVAGTNSLRLLNPTGWAPDLDRIVVAEN